MANKEESETLPKWVYLLNKILEESGRPPIKRQEAIANEPDRT